MSLELDGSLSSFEQRLLDRHLDRCDECSGYARDVAELTLTLRAAPLLRPRPIATRFQRRRRLQPAGGLMAAAAVAAAAIFAFSALRTTSGPPPAFASNGAGPSELALIGSSEVALGVRRAPILHTMPKPAFVRGVLGLSA